MIITDVRLCRREAPRAAISGSDLLAGLASDWPRPAPSLVALARLEAAPVFTGAGANRSLRRRVV